MTHFHGFIVIHIANSLEIGIMTLLMAFFHQGKVIEKCSYSVHNEVTSPINVYKILA